MTTLCYHCMRRHVPHCHPAPPPTDPSTTVYVAAGSEREAGNYAHLHFIDRSRIRYVYSPHQLAGVQGGELVLVGSYYLNDRIDDIRRKAAECGMAIKHSIT